MTVIPRHIRFITIAVIGLFSSLAHSTDQLSPEQPSLEQPSTGRLSLEAAINTGLKQNFGIQIARNTATQAENTRKLAISSLLPTLDIQGSTNLTASDQSTTSPFGFEGNASGHAFAGSTTLSWTIFDGFRMFNAYRYTHQQSDHIEAKTRDDIERAVLKIIDAYFYLATQQALLALLEKQVALSNDRLNRMKSKQKLGRISERAVLNAQVTVNSDQSTLNDQKLIVTTAQSQLNVAMGYPPHLPVSLDEKDATVPLPSFTRPYEAWLQLAMANNADLRSMRLEARLAALDMKMKKAAFWPKLIATGSYGYTQFDTKYPDISIVSTSIQRAAGISLTWNLFNGRQDEINYRNAQLAYQNASLAKAQKMLQLKALVYEQFQRVQNYYNQVRFETTTTDLAEKTLAITKDLFERGKVSGIEFRESQLNAMEAAVRLKTHRYLARVALAELERLGGHIRLR